MSKRDNGLYLVDILIAIDKISRYTSSFKDAKELLYSEMNWDATIRELEIIGEATKELLKAGEIDPYYKRVVNFRNQIIHGYFGIDEEIVWDVITDKLPSYKEMLLKLIEDGSIDIGLALKHSKNEYENHRSVEKLLNNLSDKIDNKGEEMKKLFLIIGAPGSGKTTDAELIAKKHDNITHYSTGDMFRAEVASGSERGELIKSYIDNGNLVPIDIVIETIVGAIKKSPTDVVIIDGYPRSVEQMEELDKYLANEKDVELVSVIEVVVSEQTARDRVLGRGRGADDNNEVFDNRMKVYSEPLKDIQNFYEAKGILHKEDGEGSIEEIIESMDRFVQSKI